MQLQAVYVVGRDPEDYIRKLACDALRCAEVDLTHVTFVTDDDGVTIATGVVYAAG
jgi:hypothetical protein